MNTFIKSAVSLSLLAALAAPALASAQIATPTYWCGSYYSTYPCGSMPYYDNYNYYPYRQFPYYPYNNYYPYNYNNYSYPYNYANYNYNYPYNYNYYYQYPQYWGYYTPACTNAYGYCNW